MLDETKHEVTIGEKEQEPVEVSVENTPLGIVQLTKTDVDTNEALEGVEFELQKKNDSGDYEKVETEESFITNENGQIQTTEALDAGDYQFVEVKTLDGYRINEEPVKFEIKANEVTNIELKIKNEKINGSVK